MPQEKILFLIESNIMKKFNPDWSDKEKNIEVLNIPLYFPDEIVRTQKCSIWLKRKKVIVEEFRIYPHLFQTKKLILAYWILM